jgi:hypothetical protein
LLDLLQLVVKYFDSYRYGTFSVRELKGIGQKVEQNLKKPALVSMQRLYEVEVCELINAGDEFYLALTCTETEHLKSLVDDVRKTEIVVVKFKRVVF